MEKKENAKHYRNMSIRLQMDTLAFGAESIAYTVCQHFGIEKGDWENEKNFRAMREELELYSYFYNV